MSQDGPSEVRTVPALREPAHLVSPRAVAMWTVRAVLVSLVPLGLQAAWWLLDDGPTAAHLAVGVTWAVVTLVYVIAMPRWRYLVHRWEATPVAIYTQTGWLNQERRIAPLSRVQTVDLQRGPIAQLLGLASVTVTTASAAGPVRIHGLDLPVAVGLVESLTAAAVLDQGDAT